MENINEVEIFAAGTWNGMKFTAEDLQEIVDNTMMLIQKGRVKPPVKLGHSSNQILKGQSDGDPSLGWIESIKVKGSKIVANLTKIPDILMKAVKQDLYKQVSVEMEHVKHTGWIMTGIALLGADIPAVKTLEDLQAFLSEEVTEDITCPVLFAFAEPVIAMDLEESPKPVIEEKNMSEEIKDTSAEELAQLKAELAGMKAENQTFKEKEQKAAFSQASETALEVYAQAVTDGKLTPALYEKVKAHFATQELSFSEGQELTVTASLQAEIMSSSVLPKGEEGANFSQDEETSGLTADEVLERKIADVMTSTGKDYFAASDLVANSNPELFSDYKEFTVSFYGGK